MRIVLDTNVYISGLLVPDSNPGKILCLIAEGQIELLYSRSILEEIADVLRRKIKYREKDVKSVIRFIELNGELVRLKSLVEVVAHDHSDNRILECAIDGHADFLVTGDKKHLLPLKEIRRIPIISPADFLRGISF